MSFEAIMGLVRHVLTFGGGFLVTGGLADSSTVETGVGAVVTLIGIVWSVLNKKGATA